jgi:hypothetical protein
MSLALAWYEARRLPRDSTLPADERVIAKYDGLCRDQLQRLPDDSESSRQAVIQTNTINRERELAKLGRSEHPMFQDDPFS